MNEMFVRVKRWICAAIGQLRANMGLLFFVACIMGAVIKVGVSPFITMGYNDYLTDRHNGVDFVLIRQEIEKKNQEAMQQQAVLEEKTGDQVEEESKNE